MRELLVATRSRHKMVEIRKILSGVPDLRVLDLDAVEVPRSEDEDELEPYDTFEANARSKAAYFRRLTDLPTVADDSGLEVDALDGAPGVRSKRFAPAGEGLEGRARDRANNDHLVELLSDVPISERTARFVCVAVLDRGGDRVEVFRGETEGLILDRPRGTGGFGYDPHFFHRELGRTFAEMSREEKNRLSHRGRAFRALAGHLESRR